MHLYRRGFPLASVASANGGEALREGNVQVIDVEGGEGVLAGSVAVAVRQRSQLLQALGDRGREAVLARHVRVQQDVLGRLALVAAVGAPQLLHLRQLQRGCQ